jgi:hypothetical protein
MASPTNSTFSNKTTSHNVVLPFYVFATLFFCIATAILLLSTESFLDHYFHPHILAITHAMTLGWGTMVILGASYQLLPVLIENKLYSTKLAYITFIFAAMGIPSLIYGFYVFDMGYPTQVGGVLIIVSILTYLINVGVSIYESKNENIHATYLITSIFWLLMTVVLGFALAYNFTSFILPENSIHYLPLHVYFGIVGWFMLLIIGVSSRLIPMFLISKYKNTTLLMSIYILINASILTYFILFQFKPQSVLYLVPLLLLLIGLILYGYFCYQSYFFRIRKTVDAQMKLSLLSAVIIIVPVILIIALFISTHFMIRETNTMFLSYGFIIIFGWLTALILGMTFKTLPFIIWNKEYLNITPTSATPAPKDLFNHALFKSMVLSYLSGLIIFVLGVTIKMQLLLKLGAVLLLISAVIYAMNIIIILKHKSTSLQN